MSIASMAFDPSGTPRGKLPPWEAAKAVAFEQVIDSMQEHLGKTCWQLTGKGKAEFTAEQLTVVGGGQPTGRAVRKLWAKAKEDDDWFPGKTAEPRTGRPPSISVAQKQAIAVKQIKKQTKNNLTKRSRL